MSIWKKGGATEAEMGTNFQHILTDLQPFQQNTVAYVKNLTLKWWKKIERIGSYLLKSRNVLETKGFKFGFIYGFQKKGPLEKDAKDVQMLGLWAQDGLTCRSKEVDIQGDKWAE